jgi:hypothetical protein
MKVTMLLGRHHDMKEGVAQLLKLSYKLVCFRFVMHCEDQLSALVDQLTRQEDCAGSIRARDKHRGSIRSNSHNVYDWRPSVRPPPHDTFAYRESLGNSRLVNWW